MTIAERIARRRRWPRAQIPLLPHEVQNRLLGALVILQGPLIRDHDVAIRILPKRQAVFAGLVYPVRDVI